MSINENVAGLLRQANDDGLTWDAIHAAGGPSPATLTKIASGQDALYTLATTFKLDKGLGWMKGTTVALSQGVIDEPIAEAQEGEYAVSRAQLVGGVGQGGPRHGNQTMGEITLEERKAIAQAVGLLAEAVEILRRVAEPAPDDRE